VSENQTEPELFIRSTCRSFRGEKKTVTQQTRSTEPDRDPPGTGPTVRPKQKVGQQETDGVLTQRNRTCSRISKCPDCFYEQNPSEPLSCTVNECFYWAPASHTHSEPDMGPFVSLRFIFLLEQLRVRGPSEPEAPPSPRPLNQSVPALLIYFKFFCELKTS